MGPLLGLISMVAGSAGLDKLGLGGSKTKVGNLPTMTPEQQQVLSQLLGGLKPANTADSPLYGSASDLIMQLLSGQPDDAMESQVMNQYQRQVVPDVLMRYGGGKASSALNQALAQSSQDLMGQLAAMRSQRQMAGLQYALPYAQAPAQDYQNLASLGLGVSPFQSYQKPGSPSMLQGLLGGVAGPMGNILGESLGGSLVKYLGGR